MNNFEFAKKGHDEWLTPKYITDALGPFDLDPCSPINRPWDTAALHWNKDDDGLSREWKGFVWMNPPYGRETSKWMFKLHSHGDGIALIFVRTETSTFFKYVWGKASAILFIKSRLSFCYVNGESACAAGAPSCLIAYGDRGVERLESALSSGAIKGYLVHL
jgi:hypothetical protein